MIAPQCVKIALVLGRSAPQGVEGPSSVCFLSTSATLCGKMWRITAGGEATGKVGAMSGVPGSGTLADRYDEIYSGRVAGGPEDIRVAPTEVRGWPTDCRQAVVYLARPGGNR